MDFFKKALKVAITEKVEALRLEVDEVPTLVQYANEKSLTSLGSINTEQMHEVIEALLPNAPKDTQLPIQGELSIVNFGELKLICCLEPKPTLFVFIPPHGNQLQNQIWNQLKKPNPAQHLAPPDGLDLPDSDAGGFRISDVDDGDAWANDQEPEPTPNAISSEKSHVYESNPTPAQEASDYPNLGQPDNSFTDNPEQSFNPNAIDSEYEPENHTPGLNDNHLPKAGQESLETYNYDTDEIVPNPSEPMASHAPPRPPIPPMEPVAGDFVSEQSNSFDTRSELPEDFDKAPLKKPFKIHFGAFQPGESIDSGIDQPINKLLKIMVEKNASDLHLSQTQPIILRIDGNITRLNQEPINEALMEELILPIMPKKNLLEFALNNDTDFSYEIRNLARFRVNVFRNINGVAAVLRQIPNRVLTMEELNLPSAIRSLCNLNKGLVVVTGPTGSGKSTTLAAMIDHINKTRSEHILTIEDPVEFIHQPQSCIINQREVHKHTESFSKALRAALREDPDIVMIGEMRDLETVAIAIETAETGHLVFGTLHTNTAISTVDRLIDQFPADQQEQIRVMLAASLKGVVSQTLIPKIGGGRCAAQEILIVDKAVSSLIRESNTHMIQNHMQTQKSKGNILLNEALFTMVKKGKITAEDAYLKAAEKEAFISLARQKGIVLSTAS